MTTRRFFFQRLLAIGALTAFYGFSVYGQIWLQPYLQNPATDGITIMWQTNDPSYSYVEYGTDTDNLKVGRIVEHGIVAANITKYKVRLTGLTPDTKYFYRICTQTVLKYQDGSKELGPEHRTAFFSFTTLGTTAENFTCIIFTDLHNNTDLCDKLMAQVRSKGIEYDFSIFNGDIFQNPPSEATVFGLISAYNRSVDAANKPAIYLRGNHETRGLYALQFPQYFDWKNGQPYFAFNYGDTRFVFLDNGEDKNDGHIEYSGLVDFDSFRKQQTDWLINELAGEEFTNAFRKILVHHIPLYGYTNDVDPGFFPCFDLWDPIFSTTPFDVDITGHLHGFRFLPKGSASGGNPFPLVVGGGSTEQDGRVMVLIKKGEVLTIKALDVNGNVSVHPIYRDNPTLESVTLTGGELVPAAFDPQQTEYQIVVASQISTLSLTGYPTDATATVQGNITDKLCIMGEKIILTVVADDGTEKSYTFTLTASTGTEQQGMSAQNIKLYPNPSGKGSILHADLSQYYDTVTVKFLNETGAVVQTNRLQGRHLEIPLALQQGMYIVVFNADKKQIAQKFAVQ